MSVVLLPSNAAPVLNFALTFDGGLFLHQMALKFGIRMGHRRKRDVIRILAVRRLKDRIARLFADMHTQRFPRLTK